MCIHDSLPEEWRRIPGTRGEFSASTHGRIRYERYDPRTGKIAFAWPGKIVPAYRRKSGGHQGRASVSICVIAECRTICSEISHLIALAFIGPRPRGYEINHIDGDRAHDCYWNLEYITPKRNQEHARQLKLHVRGERQHLSKLTEETVKAIRRRLASGQLQKDIAADYGVTPTTISAIARGITWQHVAEGVDLLSKT